MDDMLTPFVLLQLLTSIILGALIGLERELAKKDPGLRTFMLICLGSCVFSLVSIEAPKGAQIADPGRIAAQIVTGVGFLGAGAIFQLRNKVNGLTTAALIWIAAAIGMLVGFGKVLLAIVTTLMALGAILILNQVHRAFVPGLRDKTKAIKFIDEEEDR